MKNVNKVRLYLMIAVWATCWCSVATAQDDLYYNPSTDAPAQQTYVETYENEPGNVTRRYNDDDYSYDDDYAYEYSSRIRRFHRRSAVIDYYDPFYVDLYNYDPFFLPGVTIYTLGYNDYWTWRRWRRWQRWNTWTYGWNDWGWGYNSWGWNSWGWGGPNYGGWGWNRPWGWGNTFVYNNYFYDPYWTWNGYNPYYCPNYNNNYYGDGWYNNNNNNNNQRRTYTGVRRNGTVVNPGYARVEGNPRLTSGVPTNNTPLDPKRADGTRLGKPAANPGQPGVPPANVRTTPRSDQSVRPVTDPNRSNPNVRQAEPAPGVREKPTSEPVNPNRQNPEARPQNPPKANPAGAERIPQAEPQRPRTAPAERPRTETPPPSQRSNEGNRQIREERPSRQNAPEARPSRPATEERSSRQRESGNNERSYERNRSSNERSINSSSSGRSSGDGGGRSSSGGGGNNSSSRSSSGGGRGRGN